MRLMKYFLLILLLGLTSMVILPNAQALDCPLGLINDTAPGSCVLYIDKNADALCDLSQPGVADACDANLTTTDLTSTEIKSMTVEQVAEHYNIEGDKFAKELSKVAGVTVTKLSSFQVLHDNYGLRPVTIREIAVAMSQNSAVVVASTPTSTTSTHTYPIIAIVIGTHLLYFLTFILSKKEIITTALHRKIWNWLLLIVFIPVMVTSLLWLLRVEYNIIIPVFFNIAYWHVVLGLIMIIISAFHIIWHVKYYFTVKK